MTTARKYMASKNPIQSALSDQGLTLGILKREGLPMLREGRFAEQIKNIPGSNFLISQVENYINKAARDAPSDTAGASAPAAATQKAGNPFPPLKPR